MNTSWSFAAERMSLVGRDVECTLQQESIMAELYSECFEPVLAETGNVSCL